MLSGAGIAGHVYPGARLRGMARAFVAGLIVSATLSGMLAAPARTQDEESEEAAAAESGEARPFRLYRWQEDYSYLANKPQRDQWEQLKYIPLPGLTGTYLSLGGEGRYRLDGYGPYLFGLGKSGSSWASNQERLFMDFDLHVGQVFRTFVQFDAAHENGRPVQRAYDQSAPDLRQGFVDLVLPLDLDVPCSVPGGKSSISATPAGCRSAIPPISGDHSTAFWPNMMTGR